MVWGRLWGGFGRLWGLQRSTFLGPGSNFAKKFDFFFFFIYRGGNEGVRRRKALKTSPKLPKASQRLPKDSPNVSQSSPKPPKASPKAPPESPRVSQSLPKVAPRSILKLQKLPKPPQASAKPPQSLPKAISFAIGNSRGPAHSRLVSRGAHAQSLPTV